MSVFEGPGVTLHHGDCIEVMRTLPDASVDAVVTDPPYALEFMGRGWDKYTPLEFELWVSQWAAECLRVLKPGGHMLAFGGSRTWHRLAAGIEDAGFDIRDSIAWLYGSGFPKSLDVSKAIDKAAGAERDVVGTGKRSRNVAHEGWDRPWMREQMEAIGGSGMAEYPLTAPATDEAREWEGWGTALKPAFEPIVVGRKPLIGTVAKNVLEHGTGALNIDATRTVTSDQWAGIRRTALGMMNDDGWQPTEQPIEQHDGGRWPTNVLLDESQAAELDAQSGYSRDGVAVNRNRAETRTVNVAGAPSRVLPEDQGYGGGGGASRFFPTFRDGEASADKRYTTEGATNFAATPGARREATHKSGMFPTFHYEAKAPSSERPDVDGVMHPTVKPLDLMRWLVRLVTPPNGTILEPFAGSGTTLEAALIEGFNVIGIEREADYLPLIKARITKPLQPAMFGDWDVTS